MFPTSAFLSLCLPISMLPCKWCSTLLGHQLWRSRSLGRWTLFLILRFALTFKCVVDLVGWNNKKSAFSIVSTIKARRVKFCLRTIPIQLELISGRSLARLFPALNYWLIMALPITALFLRGFTTNPQKILKATAKFYCSTRAGSLVGNVLH